MHEEQNYGDNWVTQFWVLQLPNSSQTGQTVLDYLCVKPYDESILSDLYDMYYLDPPCYFTAIAMYIKKRISFLQYLQCYGAVPSFIYSCSIGHILEHGFSNLGCWAVLWKISEMTKILLKYATFWGGLLMFSWPKN